MIDSENLDSGFASSKPGIKVLTFEEANAKHLVLTVTSFLRMGVILQGGYIHLLFKSERDPYKEGPSHLLLKRESDPYEQCSCYLKVKWISKGRVLSLLREMNLMSKHN